MSCADKNNGVTGWARPIESKVPAAAGTVSVALTGNSVLAAFVQESPYYTASHMAVLTPKAPGMTLAEKLWWASCIRANRYRFGFGRKADRTIRDLVLPDAVPSWVGDASVRDDILALASAVPDLPVESAARPGAGTQLVSDLFDVQNGNGLVLVNLKRATAPDGVNFVARSRHNNGAEARVMPPDGEFIWEAGLLTVALGGSSALSTHVQAARFVTAFHVAVLTPRREMSLPEKLWWCCCVEANKYRYGYGRQANRTLAGLSIPVNVPQWAGRMPHDAVEELRERILRISEPIEESGFEKFEDLARKLLQVPKSEIKD